MRKLTVLIDEIALSDQHQAVAPDKARQRFGDAGKTLDRFGQHLPPGIDDFRNHRFDTRPLVTSTAVSIIERMNPFTP